MKTLYSLPLFVHQHWGTVFPFARSLAVRVLLIGASFCAGLVVFYIPERQYAAVSEVWLPKLTHESREDILTLPVKVRFDDSEAAKSITFLPSAAGGPEIVHISTDKDGMRAAKCPDLYGIDEILPSGCVSAGKVDGTPVYAITRRLPSMNVNAYMERGDTLIALSGVYSNEQAVAYFKGFVEVARRDVDAHLSQNNELADKEITTIKQEKRTDAQQRANAYSYLPFEPVLPSILPAGWIQYSVRILGDDPKKPTGVDVLYKKGRDRFIGLTMLPKSTFRLSGLLCGPTPGAGNQVLPCGSVPKQDYFTAGTSGADWASWYIYRPVGDVVAVLSVSVHDSGGKLLFSPDDLEIQEAIAKSLRPAGKDRLKGAEFVSSYYDPYPDIKP